MCIGIQSVVRDLGFGHQCCVRDASVCIGIQCCVRDTVGCEGISQARGASCLVVLLLSEVPLGMVFSLV